MSFDLMFSSGTVKYFENILFPRIDGFSGEEEHYQTF
jgi:hypothetical protein